MRHTGNLLAKLKRLAHMLRHQGVPGTLQAGVDKVYRLVRGRPMGRFSQITSRLWLGGQPSARGLRWLAAHGVTGLVNLRSEYDYARLIASPMMRYLHLPTDDETAPALKVLQAGVDFIREEVEAGGRVYVHCWEGLGRGPTLVAAYFVSQGYTPAAAWARIRQRRPFVRPTTGQQEQLRLFAQTYHPGAAMAALPERPAASGPGRPPRQPS